MPDGKLGELVDLVATIGFGENPSAARDLLGQVYEYFLGQFASAEGKNGGQFYTPASIVKTLVEVLAPHHGKVYDPCCGSGGMFVQSEEFIEAHSGKLGDVSIYGQESNPTTWRLAAMNLAIRGIDFNLQKPGQIYFRHALRAELSYPTNKFTINRTINSFAFGLLSAISSVNAVIPSSSNVSFIPSCRKYNKNKNAPERLLPSENG